MVGGEVMLTIEAKVNIEYYFNVHDEWEGRKYIIGKLAERLGLQEENKFTFDYVNSLRQRRQKNERKGVDLTFSAPKSVSILGIFLGDERVEMAHNEAVRETIEVHIEKLVGTVVKEKGKRRWEQAEAAFICINHYLSRNLDPQLHTHAVVPATVLWNGEYRAIDVKKILDEQKNLGRIYRYKLAEKLKELGYEIDYINHEEQYWEVRGMPKSLVQLFSTRDREIKKRLKEVLKEKGIDPEDPKNRRLVSKFQKYLAYMTRGIRKKVEFLGPLRMVWEQRMRKEIGLSLEELKKRVRGEVKGFDVVEYERRILSMEAEYQRLLREKEKLAEEVQRMKNILKIGSVVKQVLQKEEMKIEEKRERGREKVLRK